MADIVERLRETILLDDRGEISELPDEAADEIERLREALRGLIEAHDNNWHPMKTNGAEWFTARAALAKGDGK